MALKKINAPALEKQDGYLLLTTKSLRACVREKTMKKMNLQTHEQRAAYLLIAPLMILTFVFILYPVVSNFYYSFTDWKGFGLVNWIGFDNFHTMFQDEKFWQSISNTLILLVFIPIGVFLPLCLAALLRDGLKG